MPKRLPLFLKKKQIIWQISMLASIFPVIGMAGQRGEGSKMTELAAKCMREEPRFSGIKKFEKKIWLSSPTMHGEELEYVNQAYQANWMSTVGENIDRLEDTAAEYAGVKHAVALSCGTAAIHLAVKLAAERIYGSSSGISTPNGLGRGGSLCGKRVFCSTLTFAATVNPVIYEGGEPVFIDASPDDWNMDPEALETAFEKYPDVKLVVFAHLYGFPGQIDVIKNICEKHGALLIEDAAESLGAKYKGKPTGSFGDYGVYSFNGNKIITGSSGGMLLVNDLYSASKARKWSTQSREAAPWYQHEELGYNYRMSNVIAGIVLGQWEHLEEHIAEKKRIYGRYANWLEPLGVELNPYDADISEPNYWLSCMRLSENSLCAMTRSDLSYTYENVHGRTCPMEVLEALEAFGAEGRPVWKPMHLQPMYRNHEFVSVDGARRSFEGCYNRMLERADESKSLFEQGVCLPSDIKMTEDEQGRIARLIDACFSRREFAGCSVYSA